MNRRIFIVGPSGAGKTTIATDVAECLGLPLFCMDDFRAKGLKRRPFVAHAGQQVRCYEDPMLWDVNALGQKIQRAIQQGSGFVAEGNHLLGYPVFAEMTGERYYVDVDFQTSLARRKTRNRGTAADWSFALIGEQQTALHVCPQKKLPGCVVLDGTLPARQTSLLILNSVK